MRNLYHYCISFMAGVSVIAWTRTASCQDSGEQPIRLVQTISMPNVTGRIDHMDVDVPGKRLFVSGLENGSTIASIPCANDADDLYYDSGRKRIYIPGGEGFISVIEQSDADHYQPLAKIPTTTGARTGLWYEKRDRFYLAIPATTRQGAALWVYAPED